MLRGLPPAYLRDLSMRTRTEYYNCGDIIYAKGKSIDRMIYVIRGNINASKRFREFLLTFLVNQILQVNKTQLLIRLYIT